MDHHQPKGGFATIRASEAGLQRVDMARKRKGWAKQSITWAGLADISQSTLKRFWQKNHIRADGFMQLCAAVGIENWESVADWSVEQAVTDPKLTQN